MPGFYPSIRLAALILIMVGSASVNLVWANSYGYVLLSEDKLPAKIVNVAVFRNSSVRVNNGRHENLQEGDLVPDIDMIREFFTHGIHSSQKPVFGDERWFEDLKKRADKAALAFSEIDFPDASAQAARESELGQFAEEYTRVTNQVRRIGGCEGAVLDEKGRIFLWRFIAPTLMEVYWNAEQLCYLRVAGRNGVRLRDREIPAKNLGKPIVSGNEFPFAPDFLPGTGRNYPLVRKIVKEFLEQGEIAEREPKRIQQAITEYRIPITKYMLREREWSRDILRNRIVMRPSKRLNGQCNGVFADKENSLWRAKLLSDGHLQLDDGEGRVFILAIPEILEKGHGKP